MLEYQYFEKQEKKLLRKKFVKPLIQDNSNEINLLLKKAETSESITMSNV